jgi:hypothetical protein
MAYYGHHYYFDTFTGNYLVGGSEDSFASWTPTSINFEPDYFKVWKILTLYSSSSSSSSASSSDDEDY